MPADLPGSGWLRCHPSTPIAKPTRSRGCCVRRQVPNCWMYRVERAGYRWRWLSAVIVSLAWTCRASSSSMARSHDAGNRVNWEHREMRDLPWPGRFDGAFCVGNSFGYLDDEGNAAFLRAVAAVLKPGARFVLETPMVLENLLGHLQERPWWRVGEMYLLVQNQYDHTRSRLDIEYRFLSNGRFEVRHGSHRAYRYAELCELMEASGFDVSVATPWTRDAHTVTFIATRR